jgi:RNA polymerase sigma-70 factor, ECF subfamily
MFEPGTKNPIESGTETPNNVTNIEDDCFDHKCCRSIIDDVTDEEIVKLILKGNKDKYADIIERYEAKLFGYIKHLINQSNDEVEDMLQEVFISAYVNLQGFDTKKNFSSWIFRIAHNKAVDYFKKKRPLVVINKPEKEEDDWIENMPSRDKLYEEIEIEKEQNREIRKAVEKLELKYRETIILYFYENKSYEEISDILHIPTSNVGVILHRAKKELKKILSQNTKPLSPAAAGQLPLKKGSRYNN